MRRICTVLPLLLIAACSRGGSGDGGAAAATATSARQETVPCALNGARDFAQSCPMEEVNRDGAEFWVVRHPDGGFRRFQIIDNGTRIATADGADEVQATRNGANLEVRVGNDRYLFPAAPAPSESASHGPG